MDKCELCEHFRTRTVSFKIPGTDTSTIIPDDWGECHEDSPQIPTSVEFRWPPVAPGESCGKFTAKEGS